MLLVPALDDLVPKGIPYVIRGAIIRGVRGIVASVISFASVGIANGTLLAQLHISPEISVLVAATITPGLLALDKYLRERGYEETTDPIPPSPPAPTSDPDVDLGPGPDSGPDDGPIDGPFPQN